MGDKQGVFGGTYLIGTIHAVPDREAIGVFVSSILASARALLGESYPSFMLTLGGKVSTLVAVRR